MGRSLDGSSRLFRPVAMAGLIAAVAWCVALLPGASSARSPKAAAHPGSHFSRVLIVVLENQNYASARKDDYLARLAQRGASFTNFRSIGHPSYPNYLAMVAGSSFGVHGDGQVNFPDDNEHATIANFLDWKSYAENYPANPKPFLGDRGKYARKHVPFLSFVKIQRSEAERIVPVDTRDPHNRFITDIQNFRSDPEKYPLPQYMFYSPNLDDDGHDPYFEPATGLKKASRWLSNFLENWCPLDDKMKGTLVVVTFDESEASDGTNHIYTVFLGDMVKRGEINELYSHYSVLKTIEDNFGLPPLHTGDQDAAPITGIWK
jgi:Phosphoesterase family